MLCLKYSYSSACVVLLVMVIHESSSTQCSSHVVSINPFESSNCEDLDLSGVAVHESCSDFQTVLLLIGKQSASGGLERNTSLPCTEIRLSSGDYALNESLKIENYNVVIKAVEPDVSVQLNGIPPARAAVIAFSNCRFVEISGISFHNGPEVFAFTNITEVVLNSTTFSYFSQGAVDIFNCLQVYATECVFEHNGPVLVPRSQPFRGQSGGLSVSFNYPQLDAALPPRVMLLGCKFYNNSAVPSLRRQASQSNLLRNIFTGRGGGCFLIFRSLEPIQVVINDGFFEENIAGLIGGALYLLTEGLYSVTITNTRFISNRSPGIGGAFFFNYGQISDPRHLNTFVAYNLEFTDNSAGYGGGIFMAYGGQRSFYGSLRFSGKLTNVTFRGNIATEFGGGFGCMVTPSSSVVFETKSEIDPIHFENCSFVANNDIRARGGALSTANLPIQFSSINTFIENTGQALVIAGALVSVRGTLEIINNDATGSDQGAVYVTSFGQMKLYHGASLKFINNRGNLGAAVVLRGLEAVPEIYSSVLYNPLCFFQFENRTSSPLSIDRNDIEVIFRGNTAVIGSAIFTRNLELCSWVRLNEPHFNTSASLRWDFVQYGEDNCNSAHVGDECNPKWHVQTPAIQLNITSNAVVSAYPGEGFRLGIELYDELGELTADELRISDEALSLQPIESQADVLVLNSSAVSYDTIDDSGIWLSFTSNQKQAVNTRETIFVNTFFTRNQKYFAEAFDVMATPCPVGYYLFPHPFEPSTYGCQCNLNNTDIVNCNGRKIQLLDGLWAMVANQSGEPTLVTYECPDQYCRCTPQTIAGVATCSFIFSELDVDAQCNCYREGILCGGCRNGTGVSVQLNRCVSCHNAYSLLIALLVLCDVVVFIALLLLFSEMPAWIYPCLFYLQILQYLTDSLLGKFQQPIYTVTGALSFYFVYDFCVFTSLSPLVSYFLRFVPFLTSLIVCPIVILIRKHLPKLTKRGGLWWIILLQYPHVVFTAMSILKCPSLPGENNEYTLRWYISGNIECFSGWHIPLAALAVLVLLLCVALLPVIFLSAQDKCLDRVQLFTYRFVLTNGVKYKWWGAVELCRRLMILLFIVAFPGNEFPVLLVLMVIIVVYGMVQPYTTNTGTALEAILSITTLILLLLRNTSQATETLGLKDVVLSDMNNSQGCVDSIRSTSRLTWLLLPLYYIPFVVLVAGMSWWILRRIWLAIKARTITAKPASQADPPALLRVTTSVDYSLLVIGGDSDEGSIQLNTYRGLN